jgi:cytochrome c oxidase subunit II
MINVAFAAETTLPGWIPLTGTDVAARWDNLYNFLVWTSIFFFVLIVGAMMYFIVAYRHKPGVKSRYITGSHTLEGIFIAVPTILLLIIFGWGYSVYNGMTQPPADAYEIRVIGKQWLWQFQYENGKTTAGEVFVPVNRPIKLVMTSEDVLHSFFIPNFRVKQDVVPGMYSSVWFTATVPGKHQVFCAEYCGTSHSTMLAKVIVLTPDQWEAWNRGKKIGDIPDAWQSAALEEQDQSKEYASADTDSTVPKTRLIAQTTLVEQGKAVYETKGCVGCHSVDGTSKIGPSHKGLYGRTVILADGRTMIADENYIRGHIENPKGTLLQGYSPVMPTFKGLITETEMNALLAYLKSLK